MISQKRLETILTRALKNRSETTSALGEAFFQISPQQLAAAVFKFPEFENLKEEIYTDELKAVAICEKLVAVLATLPNHDETKIGEIGEYVKRIASEIEQKSAHYTNMRKLLLGIFLPDVFPLTKVQKSVLLRQFSTQDKPLTEKNIREDLVLQALSQPLTSDKFVTSNPLVAELRQLLKVDERLVMVVAKSDTLLKRKNSQSACLNLISGKMRAHLDAAKVFLASSFRTKSFQRSHPSNLLTASQLVQMIKDQPGLADYMLKSPSNSWGIDYRKIVNTREYIGDLFLNVPSARSHILKNSNLRATVEAFFSDPVNGEKLSSIIDSYLKNEAKDASDDSIDVLAWLSDHFHISNSNLAPYLINSLNALNSKELLNVLEKYDLDEIILKKLPEKMVSLMMYQRIKINLINSFKNSPSLREFITSRSDIRQLLLDSKITGDDMADLYFQSELFRKEICPPDNKDIKKNLYVTNMLGSCSDKNLLKLYFYRSEDPDHVNKVIKPIINDQKMRNRILIAASSAELRKMFARPILKEAILESPELSRKMLSWLSPKEIFDDFNPNDKLAEYIINDNSKNGFYEKLIRYAAEKKLLPELFLKSANIQFKILKDKNLFASMMKTALPEKLIEIILKRPSAVEWLFKNKPTALRILIEKAPIDKLVQLYVAVPRLRPLMLWKNTKQNIFGGRFSELSELSSEQLWMLFNTGDSLIRSFIQSKTDLLYKMLAINKEQLIRLETSSEDILDLWNIVKILPDSVEFKKEFIRNSALFDKVFSSIFNDVLTILKEHFDSIKFYVSTDAFREIFIRHENSRELIGADKAIVDAIVEKSNQSDLLRLWNTQNELIRDNIVNNSKQVLILFEAMTMEQSIEFFEYDFEVIKKNPSLQDKLSGDQLVAIYRSDAFKCQYVKDHFDLYRRMLSECSDKNLVKLWMLNQIDMKSMIINDKTIFVRLTHALPSIDMLEILLENYVPSMEENTLTSQQQFNQYISNDDKLQNTLIKDANDQQIIDLIKVYQWAKENPIIITELEKRYFSDASTLKSLLDKEENNDLKIKFLLQCSNQNLLDIYRKDKYIYRIDSKVAARLFKLLPDEVTTQAYIGDEQNIFLNNAINTDPVLVQKKNHGLALSNIQKSDIYNIVVSILDDSSEPLTSSDYEFVAEYLRIYPAETVVVSKLVDTKMSAVLLKYGNSKDAITRFLEESTKYHYLRDTLSRLDKKQFQEILSKVSGLNLISLYQDKVFEHLISDRDTLLSLLLADEGQITVKLSLENPDQAEFYLKEDSSLVDKVFNSATTEQLILLSKDPLWIQRIIANNDALKKLLNEISGAELFDIYKKFNFEGSSLIKMILDTPELRKKLCSVADKEFLKENYEDFNAEIVANPLLSQTLITNLSGQKLYELAMKNSLIIPHIHANPDAEKKFSDFLRTDKEEKTISIQFLEQLNSTELRAIFLAGNPDQFSIVRKLIANKTSLVQKMFAKSNPKEQPSIKELEALFMASFQVPIIQETILALPDAKKRLAPMISTVFTQNNYIILKNSQLLREFALQDKTPKGLREQLLAVARDDMQLTFLIYKDDEDFRNELTKSFLGGGLERMLIALLPNQLIELFLSDNKVEKYISEDYAYGLKEKMLEAATPEQLVKLFSKSEKMRQLINSGDIEETSLLKKMLTFRQKILPTGPSINGSRLAELFIKLPEIRAHILNSPDIIDNILQTATDSQIAKLSILDKLANDEEIIRNLLNDPTNKTYEKIKNRVLTTITSDSFKEKITSGINNDELSEIYITDYVGRQLLHRVLKDTNEPFQSLPGIVVQYIVQQKRDFYLLATLAAKDMLIESLIPDNLSKDESILSEKMYSKLEDIDEVMPGHEKHISKTEKASKPLITFQPGNILQIVYLKGLQAEMFKAADDESLVILFLDDYRQQEEIWKLKEVWERIIKLAVHNPELKKAVTKFNALHQQDEKMSTNNTGMNLIDALKNDDERFKIIENPQLCLRAVNIIEKCTFDVQDKFASELLAFFISKEATLPMREGTAKFDDSLVADKSILDSLSLAENLYLQMPIRTYLMKYIEKELNSENPSKNSLEAKDLMRELFKKFEQILFPASKNTSALWQESKEHSQKADPVVIIRKQDSDFNP